MDVRQWRRDNELRHLAGEPEQPYGAPVPESPSEPAALPVLPAPELVSEPAPESAESTEAVDDAGPDTDSAPEPKPVKKTAARRKKV